MKIKSLSEIKKIVQNFKKQGKKIVFTNGCFDLLHYGHVKYLESAKKKGDILIVGLNSDNSVRKIKGKNRPIINENDRARIIAALESVDYVVLFNEETPLKLIKLIKPDILVKGGDWKKSEIVGKDFVISYGGSVKILKYIKNHSTSNLIKKIVKRFSK